MDTLFWMGRSCIFTIPRLRYGLRPRSQTQHPRCAAGFPEDTPLATFNPHRFSHPETFAAVGGVDFGPARDRVQGASKSLARAREAGLIGGPVDPRPRQQPTVPGRGNRAPTRFPLRAGVGGSQTVIVELDGTEIGRAVASGDGASEELRVRTGSII